MVCRESRSRLMVYKNNLDPGKWFVENLDPGEWFVENLDPDEWLVKII